MKIVGAVMGAIDSAGNFARTCYDEVTGNACFISTEHHEIHEGDHYTCQDLDADVDTGAAKYWHYKSPDTTTRVHFVFQVSTSRPATVYLFEAPTLTSDGTGLTELNNDSNSGNTATLACYKDPTVSADGTQMVVNVIGADGTAPVGGLGGTQKREREFILEQNQSYLVKVVTEADNNRVSCCAEWYEES